MPFLLWLKVLSLWPFLIDLSYIFMKLIPLLVGGRQPTLSSDLGLVVVVLPAILVLSTLLYDMFVVLAAIGAKWVLLGRFQEGSYSVSHLYLFFFEVSLLLTTAAAGVMKDCSQTIANTFFMKVRGPTFNHNHLQGGSAESKWAVSGPGKMVSQRDCKIQGNDPNKVMSYARQYHSEYNVIYILIL